ncbi:MAG: DUF2905 domain-containing protein [Nitrospirales bacterium]|nr:DUF2905 domain-containing protein [Nitrospirales bacterium]
MSGLGKILALMGLVLLGLGVLLMILAKWPGVSGGLGWLGRLPGDIVIKRDSFTVYVPLATSVILSLVGSVILYLFFKR